MSRPARSNSPARARTANAYSVPSSATRRARGIKSARSRDPTRSGPQSRRGSATEEKADGLGFLRGRRPGRQLLQRCLELEAVFFQDRNRGGRFRLEETAFDRTVV